MEYLLSMSSLHVPAHPIRRILARWRYCPTNCVNWLPNCVTGGQTAAQLRHELRSWLKNCVNRLENCVTIAQVILRSR